MKAFTKGPLAIAGPSIAEAGLNDGGDFAILDGEGMIIGEAISVVSDGVERPAMENAILWSISPQLLDALEQCEKALTRLCDLNRNVAHKRIGVDGPTVAAILGYTRTVISKVEWMPTRTQLRGRRIVVADTEE